MTGWVCSAATSDYTQHAQLPSPERSLLQHLRSCAHRDVAHRGAVALRAHAPAAAVPSAGQLHVLMTGLLLLFVLLLLLLLATGCFTPSALSLSLTQAVIVLDIYPPALVLLPPAQASRHRQQQIQIKRLHG